MRIPAESLSGTSVRDKVVTAAEAVRLIRDGDWVVVEGFVGQCFAEELTLALEQRFLLTGAPATSGWCLPSRRGTGRVAGWTGCATRACSCGPWAVIGACRPSWGRWPWAPHRITALSPYPARAQPSTESTSDPPACPSRIPASCVPSSGTNSQERDAFLPGDDLIVTSDLTATRANTGT